MKNLGRLFEQIHERSLWQVLGVYLAGSWVALEVVATFDDQEIIPGWVFQLALVLLLIGLPIVLVTAYVQKGLHTRPREERTGLGRLFTWRNAVLGGVGAFALWGVVAAAWLVAGGRPAPRTASTGELSGIALPPFDVSGDDLEGWDEGIPTLLAANLDGIGGLRKIDPRSLHTVWRRELGRETVDLEAILDFTRGKGAAYTVLGSAVGSGDRLVISVDVYDVATGRSMGSSVRVEGPADSMSSLVDRLSLEILRAGLIPADAELPRFDLTRVTTPSLEALQAFVEGEREYRRSMHHLAIDHFNEAIDLDPEFPLALFRLATTHLMEARFDLAREYADRALRHAERLPERERSLLEAYRSFAGSEDRAIDLLRDYTRRYPDDTEGWFLLGEAYYRIGSARLEPFQRFEEAAMRAIERNPYYGPPYNNLIDEAFFRRDSAATFDLVDRYSRIDRGTDWCVGYQIAAGLAWGDSATRVQATAALDTVSADPLSCVQRNLIMSPATWEAHEIAWEEQLTRDSFDPPTRADARLWHAWGLAQRGRFDESSRWFEDLYGREPSPEQIRTEMRWLIAGYEVDRLRAWADRLDRGPRTDPGNRWRLALIADTEGRPEDADGQVRALRSLADSLTAISDSAAVGPRTGDQIARLADATAAIIALRRDPDDPDLIDAAVDALFAVSAAETQLTMAMRYEIGVALVEAGRFEDARRYFESFRWADRPYKVPTQYWLGRIHQGLGNAEEARRHYGNFVTWWEDADPQFHEWREEARDRLARLLPDG